MAGSAPATARGGEGAHAARRRGGEAAPIDDPAILDAVGALIRQSGWPVEVTTGGFTAPFGPKIGDTPPWRLYRFVFHTAIGHAAEGATRWRFGR